MAATNIDQVVAWLEGFVQSFDFTRPGVDQSLGRDIVNEVCGGILTRSVTERAGADGYWPSVSDTPHPPWPSYRAAKRDRYGIDDEPNSRTGQMLSMTSLRGRTTYAPTEIQITYGTGQPPSSSAAPTGYLSAADQAVTDVQKAQWATEGTDTAPPRPFFQLDDTIEAGVFQVVADNLRQYILTEG